MPPRQTQREATIGFGLDALERSMAIYAPGRAHRPGAFQIPKMGSIPQPEPCPFCPGRENETPPEWTAFRDDSRGSWKARIIPNRFPAVPPFNGEVPGPDSGQLHGVHDVVIESDQHEPLEIFTPLNHAVPLWEMILSRLHTLHQDSRIRHLVWFRNQGSPAGASLIHPHSQILGINHLPPGIAARNRAARAFFRENQTSWISHLRKDATRRRELVVLNQEGLTALCPPASRTCYEMVVIPSDPENHRIPMRSEARPLARVLGLLVNALQKTASPQIPFNMALQLGTPRTGAWFTWHLEILPRMSQLAGWEWATGSFVNPIPPQLAARRLRENLEK